MGKRLSLKEISMARHEQEVWNSMVKRGEIDVGKFVRTLYVVCGCGAEGCGFISGWVKNKDFNVVDLEEQNKLYQQWLFDYANHTKNGH